MNLLIKSEPVDHSEIDNNPANSQYCSLATDFEKESAPESFYLDNLNQHILSSYDENDELFKELMPFTEHNNGSFDTFAGQQLNEHIETTNETNYKRLCEVDSDNINLKRKKSQNVQPDLEKLSTTINQNKKKQQEQIALEKKKVLMAIIQSAELKKAELLSPSSKFDALEASDEPNLLRNIKKVLEEFESLNLANVDPISHRYVLTNAMFKFRRLKCKLEMRKLKRRNNVSLLDIDPYANELIDNENIHLIKQELRERNATDVDTDIIFESQTLKTSVTKNSDCEIIATSRILDRFSKKEADFETNFYYGCNRNSIENVNLTILSNRISPIGIIESRNDDIKCVISPFSNKILKPYIRRDYVSAPIKLALIQSINTNFKYERAPIDYVHLRPEHVVPINVMCRQHFWNGIDVSECLNYPEYTIVVLYKNIIIGFAFVVPDHFIKEAYLSFIFVHPDWRSSKHCEPLNISISHYLMYYLIKKCADYDITLHVSVTNHVVMLYQKFGFKIEEYIKNFYDKYYSDDLSPNKDAFLMKLTKK